MKPPEKCQNSGKYTRLPSTCDLCVSCLQPRQRSEVNDSEAAALWKLSLSTTGIINYHETDPRRRVPARSRSVRSAWPP